MKAGRLETIETIGKDLGKVLAIAPTEDGLELLAALALVSSRLLAALAVANEMPEPAVERLERLFATLLHEQTAAAIKIGRTA